MMCYLVSGVRNLVNSVNRYLMYSVSDIRYVISSVSGIFGIRYIRYLVKSSSALIDILRIRYLVESTSAYNSVSGRAVSCN